jgi:WD40 repeat protein
MFFHPNGKLLIATKSNNGTFQLWDMKIKGQPVLPLPGHNLKEVYSSDNVFFSPDGSKLSYRDSQGIVRLWTGMAIVEGVSKQVTHQQTQF